MDGMEVVVDEPIIHDDMEAEEAIRKIQYWQEQERVMLEHYDRQIEAAKERCEGAIAYHKKNLMRYFSEVPHVKAKTQESYTLPSGKMVMKKECDKLVKPTGDKEKEILLSLAEQGVTEYIKTTVTESLNWQEYKKRLSIVDGKAVDTETAEIVDVAVEHVEPKFEIALNTKGENDNGEENQAS